MIESLAEEFTQSEEKLIEDLIEDDEKIKKNSEKNNDGLTHISITLE